MTVIQVHTPYENRIVVGGSTLIVAMPVEFYTASAGLDPAQVGVSLQRMALKMSFDQAGIAGCLLHHAEFIITADPERVVERAILRHPDGSVLHDCPECQDGLNIALAHLSCHPDQELLVGQLFWAATR